MLVLHGILPKYVNYWYVMVPIVPAMYTYLDTRWDGEKSVKGCSFSATSEILDSASVVQ